MKNFKKGHGPHEKHHAAEGEAAQPGSPDAAVNTPPEGATSAAAGSPPPAAEVDAGIPLPAVPPVSPEKQLDDRLLRLQADFENYRKRSVREKIEMTRRANEDLIGALLPVMDNLARGLQQAREHKAGEAFMAGLQMVHDQFAGVLRKFGVVPMETVGQPFDPRRHEAIAHMPSAGHPEGTVLQETLKGYLLGDALLRPAQVVVASPLAAAEAAAVEEEAES